MVDNHHRHVLVAMVDDDETQRVAQFDVVINTQMDVAFLVVVAFPNGLVVMVGLHL